MPRVLAKALECLYRQQSYEQTNMRNVVAWHQDGYVLPFLERARKSIIEHGAELDCAEFDLCLRAFTSMDRAKLRCFLNAKRSVVVVDTASGRVCSCHSMFLMGSWELQSLSFSVLLRGI